MSYKREKLIALKFFALITLLMPLCQSFVGAQQEASPLRQRVVINSDANVSWHPSENWILAVNIERGNIELWDVITGELIREFEYGPYPILVEFNNDGSLIANLSGFFFEIISTQNRSEIYNVDFSTINPEDSHGDISSDLSWHPSEMEVAFAHEYDLGIYDAVTQELRIYEPEDLAGDITVSIDWHPRGELIATHGLSGKIVIRESDTLAPVTTLSWDTGYHSGLPYVYGAYALEWNPEGTELAVISYNPTDWKVLIWDIETETISTRLPNYGGTITALSWSPDRRNIAVAYGTDALNSAEENVVRVFDTVNYEILGVGEGHGDTINSLSWSPDSSMLASAGDDGTVHIWDVSEAD